LRHSTLSGLRLYKRITGATGFYWDLAAQANDPVAKQELC